MALRVKDGARGLRQSDALFQHIQNLPALVDWAFEQADEIGCVCVSAKPRPQKDSYMPVFFAGLQFARVLAGGLRAPLYETTHQEGHLYAAKPDGLGHEYIAFHVSGGTTEVLHVKDDQKGRARLSLIGGSSDLHAGQFIDRIGVALGLPFPCGKALYALLEDAREISVRLPVSVKGGVCSFSGVETQAQRMVGKESAESIALAVHLCIAQSLFQMLENVCAQTGVYTVLLFGGVMESLFIREKFALWNEQNKYRIHFAKPGLSMDNAVGVARIGTYRWREEE
ncbi:MAG: O-sialoglycoprotein endopeptidase [Christensenellales bacterium]